MRVTELLKNVKNTSVEDLMERRSIKDFFTVFQSDKYEGKDRYVSYQYVRKSWKGYVGWCHVNGYDDIYSYDEFFRYCFDNDHVNTVETYVSNFKTHRYVTIGVWSLHDDDYNPVKISWNRKKAKVEGVWILGDMPRDKPLPDSVKEVGFRQASGVLAESLVRAWRKRYDIEPPSFKPPAESKMIKRRLMKRLEEEGKYKK